jgi:hypothetical protein
VYEICTKIAQLKSLAERCLLANPAGQPSGGYRGRTSSELVEVQRNDPGNNYSCNRTWQQLLTVEHRVCMGPRVMMAASVYTGLQVPQMGLFPLPVTSIHTRDITKSVLVGAHAVMKELRTLFVSCSAAATRSPIVKL